MTDTTERPLVTFYVITYNQAQFVREAVEGALAQTYSPTEILLSDDCSTDGTFEIIQEVVKGYSGPHKIVLNRNDRNLGLSMHVNKIMDLATGELIVAADGDDVSYPQRTERCVDAWLKNGKPAALATSVSCIDAAGNPSGDGAKWFAQFLPSANESRTDCLLRFSREGSPRLVSCSAAWTKELFNRFGPLAADVWYEDDVITLRAWLFDRIVFVPEAFVRYRQHDSNLFNRAKTAATSVHAREQAERAARTNAQRRRELLESYIPDLDLGLNQGWIAHPAYEEFKRNIEKQGACYRIIEDWWSFGWIKRVAFILFLGLSGRLPEARWSSARLVPFRVFLLLGALWARLRMCVAATWHLFHSPESALIDMM